MLHADTDILKQFDMTRDTLLKSVQSVTEAEADKMLHGFNNTIRWHIGHIVFASNLAFIKARSTSHLSPDFIDLFKGGTSPRDWTTDVPSMPELLDTLLRQQSLIRETFAGCLNEKLEAPFIVNAYGGHEFLSIGEALNFFIFHEAMHLGYINALKRMISACS